MAFVLASASTSAHITQRSAQSFGLLPLILGNFFGVGVLLGLLSWLSWRRAR
jgi:formate/nitrite transporter FocA (FNT family)